MAKESGRTRRAPASTLCKHFEDTDLVGCARAGLDCLEANHKAVVTGGASIGCGVALDACRREKEPHAPRWDYVFMIRNEDTAIAVEVHHAGADQVEPMIAKKAWALGLLASRCPKLTVAVWVWVASPPDGTILLLRQSPAARRLLDAGISFPTAKCELP